MSSNNNGNQLNQVVHSNLKGKKNRVLRNVNKSKEKKFSPASQKAYKHRVKENDARQSLRPTRVGMSNVAGSGYKDMWGLLRHLLFTNGLPHTYPDTVMRVLGWLSKANIISVQGQYDSMHDILTQCGLPCQVVTVDQLPEVLRKTKRCLLLCNCTGLEYPNNAREAIKAALQDGRIQSMVTTDWCVRSVFMPLFPNVVVSGIGEGTPQTGGHCSVHCETQVLTPFTHNSTTEWWSEASSYTWKAGNLENPGYEVLARSNQDDGDQALKRGRELAIRYYPHGPDGPAVIHLLTHLKMKMVNESAKVTKEQLMDNFHLSSKLIDPILVKGFTVPTIQTLLTSGLTMMGLIVDCFARDALVQDFLPQSLAVSQDSLSVEQQLLEMGKAILYPCFSRTVDHAVLLEVAKSYLEDKKQPDFLLKLAKYLRLNANLNELPALLIGLVVDQNANLPLEERSKVRTFCKSEFHLSVRDLILIHEKTRGPKGSVKKMLQRIFNDHWDKFNEKQLRSQMGSAYSSQKHPVAPRELLKEMLKGSHPKHSQKGARVLSGKLPKVENIVDVTTSAKTQEEYQEGVKKLLVENKMSARQVLKNIRRMALCEDQMISQSAIQVLEKSKQVLSIQPPDFTNAALSLMEGVYDKGFQGKTVKAIAERPQDENVCLICLDHLRNTILLPCKHVVSCQDCSRIFQEQNQPCPLCRQKIEGMEQGQFAADYIPWHQSGDAQPKYDSATVDKILQALMQSFQRASAHHLGCRVSGKTAFLLDNSTAMRLSDLFTPQMALALMIQSQTDQSCTWFFNGDHLDKVEKFTLYDICQPSYDLNVKNLTTQILDDQLTLFKPDRLIVMSVQSGHYAAVKAWAQAHPTVDVTIVDGTGNYGHIVPSNITYLSGYSHLVAKELNPKLSLTAEMRRLLPDIAAPAVDDSSTADTSRTLKEI